jgi:hypothetical protein
VLGVDLSRGGAELECVGDAMGSVEVRDDDLAGMIKLLQEQEQHFEELARYASSRCGDTSGMTQLMGLLAPKVKDLADWSSWKLNRCCARMGSTVHDLTTVRQLYADTERGHVRESRVRRAQHRGSFR